MTGFIRDLINDRIIAQAQVKSFDLPVETLSDGSGTAKLVGEYRNAGGRWLWIPDENILCKIGTKVECTDGETNLPLLDPLFAFEVQGTYFKTEEELTDETAWKVLSLEGSAIPYITSDTDPQPAWNTRVIETENQPGAVGLNFNNDDFPEDREVFEEYIPYAGLTLEGCGIELVAEEDSGDFVYYANINKTLENLRAVGMFRVEAEMVRANITEELGYVHACLYKVNPINNLTGAYLSGDAILVPVNDGHSFLSSENYDYDIVSMVVLYSSTLAAGSFQRFVYYLHTDLTVSAVAENRLYGGAVDKMTEAASWEDGLAEALDIFAENVYSHKIVFHSDKVMHIGQRVKLLFPNGDTFDTSISEVRLKSGNDRRQYTCGELSATATERIRSNSWKYGARRPRNPRKGELFFEV